MNMTCIMYLVLGISPPHPLPGRTHLIFLSGTLGGVPCRATIRQKNEGFRGSLVGAEEGEAYITENWSTIAWSVSGEAKKDQTHIQ